VLLLVLLACHVINSYAIKLFYFRQLPVVLQTFIYSTPVTRTSGRRRTIPSHPIPQQSSTSCRVTHTFTSQRSASNPGTRRTSPAIKLHIYIRQLPGSNIRFLPYLQANAEITHDEATTTSFQILPNYRSQTTQPFEGLQSDYRHSRNINHQYIVQLHSYSGPLTRGAQTPGEKVTRSIKLRTSTPYICTFSVWA
jgi:hypothetical protein